MPRERMPLNAKQELFIRMSARGCSRREIMQEVFGVDLDTAPANVITAKDVQMHRWRKLPEFDSVWKDEVRTILQACSSEAISVIREQMRSEEGWLRNKAAMDLLNYGKGQIYGEDDKTVHVQIEGLPEIGSPDQEE